jgi:lysozyme family protein
MSYDQAFGFTVPIEGAKLDLSYNDPGNWTGRDVGKGMLKGSKFGISAAAFPDEDIANLTVARAKELFKAKYWDKIRGDELPPRLAYIVFDAAVNNGVSRASAWLQAVCGATMDGVVGPDTVAKAAHGPQNAQIVAFMGYRLYFMGCLPQWKAERGWADRIPQVIVNAFQIQE